MKRSRVSRPLVALLAAALLLSDLLAVAPPAAAQVTPVNAALGLFRVINAINRRNRIYQAGRDTQKDFNAYYGSLQNTARSQLVSGELTSLRRGETGLEPVRAAAYIRLTAALAAEQAAVTRAIGAETNQARRDFNRTLVRQLQEVVIRLPGAQQILGEVRTLISNVRNTVIALQTAAAANQPLDVLTQRLAEQVSSSEIVQDRVRNLGSMLGPDLDRALGGALTQVNNTIQDVNREANQAVELLDGMDGQVAALDLSQAEVAEGGTTVGPVNIRLPDRATAVLDVASQALAFLSAMQGTGGTTREEMYQQIRSDLLQERNAELLDAAQHVSLVVCAGVGRGEYEVAVGMLGKAPETAADPAKATYMVCSDRETGQPVRAWIVRVGMPTGTPGEGTPTVKPVVHAGTYVGEAVVPGWVKIDGSDVSSERAILVNVVRLTVLEDGRVEGEMSYESQETITGQDCGSRWDYSMYGTFGGSLIDNTGSVSLESTVNASWNPFRLGEYPCGEPGSNSGSYTWTGPMQVDGGHLSGEATATDEEGGSATFTFEADRE